MQRPGASASVPCWDWPGPGQQACRLLFFYVPVPYWGSPVVSQPHDGGMAVSSNVSIFTIQVTNPFFSFSYQSRSYTHTYYLTHINTCRSSFQFTSNYDSFSTVLAYRTYSRVSRFAYTLTPALCINTKLQRFRQCLFEKFTTDFFDFFFFFCIAVHQWCC